MNLYVLDHEVRRATQIILQMINKTLNAFPSDLTKGSYFIEGFV
jgi:hypothetical protein